MQTFPRVFIPDNFMEAMKSNIPLELKEPRQPYKPIKKDVEMPWGFLIPLLMILGVFLFTGNHTDDTKTISFLSVAFLMIIIYFFNSNNDEKYYQSGLIKYEEELKIYYQEQKIYEDLKKKTQTTEKTIAYRKEKVLMSIKNTSLPQVSAVNRLGKSEIFFENYLNKQFKGKIFKNYSFSIFGYENNYIPDFIYQDENNLHIDIEIDEPYDYISGKPIHCIEEEPVDMDYVRNEFFNLRNWVVIRFAEEQIVRQPDDCCQFISNIIMKINKTDFTENLFENSRVSSIKCWNFIEAQQMSNKNYRDKYLSVIKDGASYANTWNDKIRLGKKTNPFSFTEFGLPF